MKEAAFSYAAKKRKADHIEPDIITLRKEIKQWQRDFKAKNGRVPTRDDIKHDPAVWAKHQTYANLKKKNEKRHQAQSQANTSQSTCTQLLVTPSKRRKIESSTPMDYMSPHRLKQALSRIQNSPTFHTTPFANDVQPLRRTPSKIPPDPFEEDVEIEPTPWKRHIKKLFSPDKPEIKRDLLWKTGATKRIESMDWKRKLLAAPLPSPKRLSAEKMSRQRKLFERGASIGFGISSQPLFAIDGNSPSRQRVKGAVQDLNSDKNPFIVHALGALESTKRITSPLRPTSHPNIQQSPTMHRNNNPSTGFSIKASPLPQPQTETTALCTPTKSTPRVQNVLIFPSPLAPSPRPFAFPKRRTSAMTHVLELQKMRQAAEVDTVTETLLQSQAQDLTPYLNEVKAMMEASSGETDDKWNIRPFKAPKSNSVLPPVLEAHRQGSDPDLNVNDPKPTKKGSKRQHRRVHMKPVPIKTPLTESNNNDPANDKATALAKKAKKPGIPGGVSENFVSLSYKRQEKRASGGSRFGGRFGKRK